MRKAAALLLFTLSIAPAFSQTTGTQPASGNTSQQGTPPGTPAPGAAQNPPTTGAGAPDLSIPKDGDASWLIGFTVFSSEGLSTENAYLAYSLPLLLMDAASGLTTHTLSDEEKSLVARAVITREMAASETAITAARHDRSALAFADTPPADAARMAADARVTAAEARRSFVAALDPAKVIVADTKPIVVKKGTGAGMLLDAPLVPPGVYCARQGIGMLIGGSIREVQGYLLLDVWAYDAARGKTVFTSRNAAQRDELYASVVSIGKDLAAGILGRPWSLVAFSPSPKQASLYVDGKLTVTGASPALYLSPGQHDVRIAAPGYDDVTRSLTLEEGTETRIEDVLAKSFPGRVTVSTDPVGADLYLDSVWIGKTPVEIDVPSLRSRGLLLRDGYYDKSFSFSTGPAVAYSFSLEKDIGSRDIQQKKARDEFYTSFGWFALSIPLPLFSIAFENDYASNSPTPAYIFLGTYYAGVALSVALFSWMVIRIVHYVTVSNRTAG